MRPGRAIFVGASLAQLVAAGLAMAAPSAAAQVLDFVQVWSQRLPDLGHPVALSSPNVATLGGVKAVVVGDRAGYVYAFSLASGRAVPGWPASSGGVPVDSTPSVAALSPASADDTVFVGLGDSATPHEGGYEALNPNGTERWYVHVQNPSTDRSAGRTSAVPASLAVGVLQGETDVVAPSVGQEEYALDASTGAVLPGFPWFTSDSAFSTPALADLYGDGNTEIVDGGDQSPGLADGVQYSAGGHIRVIAPTGNAGTGSPTGGLDCVYNADQVVESSPAVGPFLSGGAVGIAVGTGTYWKGASDTDTVLAFGTRCNLVWSATLDGATGSSPALADISGNGTLEVVEGTDNGEGGGSVYALDGATGSVLWRQSVRGEVIGSVVTADLGRGYQDVVVPTTKGAEVLDGQDGRLLATLETSVGLQNSPLVTEDPDGTVGITLAGYNGYNRGEVEHFELRGSSGADVEALGAWPMFHHDPQLTGNAVSLDVGPLPDGQRPSANCSAPDEGPDGYYEVGSDGHVFRYGNLAFCGSLSASPSQPIVGIAPTPDGGGYWLVSAAGEIFPFGDAKSYGSARPGQPGDGIVGMAATPDGNGYWLVSRDGEVFSFGDAKSYGPSDNPGLSAPITAMAASRDGRGYWLVSQDGAIFTFGDAKYHGSGTYLHVRDIVSIAPDTATGGYWLAGADGSVYSFGAPSYGSIAGHNIGYDVTGIQAMQGGGGYRLVDTGGELYCFGDATQLGSALTGGPAKPIVAVAAA